MLRFALCNLYSIVLCIYVMHYYRYATLGDVAHGAPGFVHQRRGFNCL